MPLRLATCNVNNLFQRARVLELEGFSSAARKVLDDVARLSGLLERESYAGQTGKDIVELLVRHDQHLSKNTDKNQWFSIQMVRGRLFKVPKGMKLPVLSAQGRADWLGWVELKRVTANEEATRNTARVLHAVNADVLCLVEVEDRPTLDRFNADLLKPMGLDYPHNLLVDGNDPRGIDIGLYSRCPIRAVHPHFDDTYTAANGKPYPVFSRDCPEFEVKLSARKPLWVLGNHFKSKGYGSQAANNRKRTLQAERVRELLGRFNLKRDLVAVAGDFNDTPNSATLAPLLKRTPDLHDVLLSPLHTGPQWTYSGGSRLDYLLVSTALHRRLKAVGVERRGILKRGNPHFPEVTSPATQASDHAAVWAEFDL
jgi:endonuclease/exonuclease/phosphatase family metal-dependent hydrolase